jgi:TonB family protein
MNKIKMSVSAPLGSSLLSVATFAHAEATAPQVETIVSPTALSRQHLGTTVQLAFTVDENGQPRDIAVVSPADRKLTASVITVESQWRFAPAMQGGVPVFKRVTMPLEI